MRGVAQANAEGIATCQDLVKRYKRMRKLQATGDSPRESPLSPGRQELR
jgi:hypothetical protein